MSYGLGFKVLGLRLKDEVQGSRNKV